MDKVTYVDLMHGIQNDDTVKLVGEIDFALLNTHSPESIYYSFPLIERLVLEIYKLVPEADIEHIDQGIMRTVCSIIKLNDVYNILPDGTISILEKYYDEDDGLRNRLFHVKNCEIVEGTISFDEINFLIMQLLSILRKMTKEFTGFMFESISYLE